MDLQRALGLDLPAADEVEERKKLHLYINLKLASSGQPTCVLAMPRVHGDRAGSARSYREKNRLLSDYYCWVDRRIQDFLDTVSG